MKKIILLTAMIIGCMWNCSFATDVSINLSQDKILINDEEITTNNEKAVYLQSVVEQHPDVSEENKNVVNKVITITKAGSYRINGTIQDTQIRVETTDSEEVKLILNDADIVCRTAPAILINSAADDEKVGEAKVKLVLENENKITGSHVAEYYDEVGNKFKNDAAISSKVSLIIEGDGSLLVNSDNEGIESKMHLTINDGTIEIFSEDDALNASEDGVSHVTINGGNIYGIVQGDGGEGDGIDSNGYITINGGFVVAQAHSASPDTGLDADLGITINGGTVIATGNMYEGIDENSEQQFMQMYFSETQKSGDVIVITDEKAEPIIAFKPINSFTILECSSPDFKSGTYYAYVGGEVTGEEQDGVYTNIVSYNKGEQLSHTGTMTNDKRRPGNMQGMANREFGGNGMQRPGNMTVDNLDFSGITLPNGVSEDDIKNILNQLMEKNFPGTKNNVSIPPQGDFGIPEGGENLGGMIDNRSPESTNNENRSYKFELTETEHVYRGVAPIATNEVVAEDNANKDFINKKEIDVKTIIIIVLSIALIAVSMYAIKVKK